MFSRGLLRSYLEMADYSVTEACEPSEACEKLASNDFDVAIVSLDLPGEGAFKVLDQLRNGVGEPSLPALALTRNEAPAPPVNGHARFDDYQAKFDRQAIIRSIEKLVGLHRTASGPERERQPQATIEA
jgi:CheY-like chemotaxis protein